MKKTKRLSIELRHREVTIAVEGPTLHAWDGEPGAAATPTVCPTCGSPWITIAARVNEEAPADIARAHRTLKQAGLHLQVSQAGQLQICQRSFDEAIKEKF